MSERPIVYLSGPIGNCTHQQIHGWRDEFTTAWGEDYVLDPSRRVWHVVRNWEDAEAIVTSDKHDIRDSQIVLVNISDPPIGHQMWGTPMEIIWSYEQGKEVIIITKDIHRLNPWVIFHSHHHFNSVKEVIAYLEGKHGLVVPKVKYNEKV